MFFFNFRSFIYLFFLLYPFLKMIRSKFCFDMQKVDFAVGAFTMTKARSDVIDFMTPIVEEPCSFILQLPVEDKLSLFIRPFHVRQLLLNILGSAERAHF